MKIVQSYLSAIVRADMSITQLRIYVIIVRRCRQLLYGRKYSKLLASQIDTSGLNLDFSVSFKTLLGKSHNYKSLHLALANMEDAWKIEYWKSEEKIWRRSSIVNNVEIDYKGGVVRFSSPKWLIEYITDFTQGGFREYTYENAFKIRTANAARLYILCCSQSKPYKYPVQELKKMLGLGDKYANFSQFETRVLKTAQKELEIKGCNGFRYTVERKGGKNGMPVSITLIPVKREVSYTEAAYIRQFKDEVPQLLSSILSQRFNFTQMELSHNMTTLSAFSKIQNYEQKFLDICERASRKRKNHGYIINALKSEVLAARAGGNIMPPGD